MFARKKTKSENPAPAAVAEAPAPVAAAPAAPTPSLPTWRPHRPQIATFSGRHDEMPAVEFGIGPDQRTPVATIRVEALVKAAHPCPREAAACDELVTRLTAEVEQLPLVQRLRGHEAELADVRAKLAAAECERDWLAHEYGRAIHIDPAKAAQLRAERDVQTDLIKVLTFKAHELEGGLATAGENARLAALPLLSAAGHELGERQHRERAAERRRIEDQIAAAVGPLLSRLRQLAASDEAPAAGPAIAARVRRACRLPEAPPPRPAPMPGGSGDRVAR